LDDDKAILTLEGRVNSRRVEGEDDGVDDEDEGEKGEVGEVGAEDDDVGDAKEVDEFEAEVGVEAVVEEEAEEEEVEAGGLVPTEDEGGEVTDAEELDNCDDNNDIFDDGGVPDFKEVGVKGLDVKASFFIP